MFARLTSSLSSFAVTRRGLILTLSFALALVMALQLPKLKVDTSPGNLVSNVDGQEALDTEYEKLFGQNGPTVIALIESDDVLSEQALKLQADLARSLSGLPAVYRVRGLVTTSFPKDLESLPKSDLFEPSDGDDPADSEARKKADQEFLDEIFDNMPPNSPPREVFRAIADAEKEAFPEGEKSLIDRLARDEDAAPHPSWAQQQDTPLLKLALKRFDWLYPALLSRDHTLAPLVVELDQTRAFDQKTRLAAVQAMRGAVAQIDIPAGVTVELGGVPVIREEIEMKLRADRRLLNPLMGIVCILILGLTFRWWPAVVAPISAVLITAVTVLGTMALLGQPLTILTNIITPLLLIVGLSDSVHLIGRYREELAREPDRQEAGRKAVHAMMNACFLTSLTTAFGFASLTAAKTPELRSFGITAACGVMLAYVATVFFVPAFITLARPPPPDSPQNASGGPLERFVASLTHRVLRHSKWIAAFSLLATVGLGFSASRIEADARLLDAFHKDDAVYSVTTKLQSQLLGIRPLELWFQAQEGSVLSPSRMAQIDELDSWISSQKDVIAVIDFATPLREMRKNLTGVQTATTEGLGEERTALAYLRLAQNDASSPIFERISRDAKHARVSVYLKDVGVKRSLAFIEELKAKAQTLLGSGTTLRMTGEAYVGSKGRAWVLRDLLGGLALALVSIFGLLTLLFRSLRFGLAAIPPNVIPLLGTAAFMAARGIELNITTVITFSVGIGLAVDNTIHLVARFREEQKRYSSVDVALIRAARGTGRAIIVTTLSLALGFAVLMASNFISVRQFGELIVVTILGCLVSALMIQPALLRMAIRRSK